MLQFQADPTLRPLRKVLRKATAATAARGSPGHYTLAYVEKQDGAEGGVDGEPELRNAVVECQP